MDERFPRQITIISETTPTDLGWFLLLSLGEKKTGSYLPYSCKAGQRGSRFRSGCNIGACKYLGRVRLKLS